jgi:hypothetical protein
MEGGCFEAGWQTHPFPTFVLLKETRLYEGMSWWDLRKWKSQLEKLKGEVDRTLEIVDEGLISFGLEGFNFLNQAGSVSVKLMVNANLLSLIKAQF